MAAPPGLNVEDLTAALRDLEARDGPLAPGERLLLGQVLEELQRRGVNLDGDRSVMFGPQNDDELWQAIYETTGYKIPRASVCIEHGHVSPFEIMADLYFERTTNVLCIGNRGGGKTTISGFLHGAKARYCPDYSSAISGAIEKQSHRAYAELKRFLRGCADEVVDSLMSKTTWGNGSENEVIGGTVRALNGPHPALAQMDEVELSTVEALEEFKNMAQGTPRYRALQLLTSTRKRAHGLVQSIAKEVSDAIREGVEPPWQIRIFCVFETMAPVKNCRAAPENAGLPEAELCDCNKVVKGKWDDAENTPRTFESVCGGRAYRSDGFVQLEDVHKRFRQLGRMTWEAQQECLRPNNEGIVHKWVNDQHRIRTWYPDPAYGPIYRSWDWGGTNPHAVLWHQLLKVPVSFNPEDPDNIENARLFKEGALITFDEVYTTDIGFYELAERVFARDVEWRVHGFDLPIEADICDPAGAAAKLDVKKCARDLGIEEPRFKSLPCPRPESVRKHIELGDDDRLYWVGSMCPGLDDEYDTYHWPDPKPGKNLSEDPEKEDDHALDSKRMLIWYIDKMGKRANTGERPAAQEKASIDGSTPTPHGQPRYTPTQTVPNGAPVASTARDAPYTQGTPQAPGVRVRQATVPGARRAF